MRFGNILSKQKKLPLFSKAQLSLIAKIAFLEAVAISIALPTIQSTGEIPPCNAPCELQSNRFGIFTMTTTAGTQIYSFNVPISPALPTAPSDIKFTTLGTNGINQIGTSTISFLNEGGSSVTGGIWTGMSTTTTELFNPGSTSTACCRSYANLNGMTNGCFLVVDIISPSNTAGAKLFVQWASATNGPWTTFTSSNVDVNLVADNPRISNTFSAQTGVGTVFLRIAGSGGGGLGDNPQFSHIEMTCSAIIGGVNISYLSPTASSFTMFVVLTVADPLGGNNIAIQWSAYVCTSGQGNSKC